MNGEGRRDSFPQDQTEEELLPTISLIRIPHPAIPHLYQDCFEYVEPWQWSRETERVETGRWSYASESDAL